jgi:ribosomal protein S18 acetylase RimI-like enzyme
MKAAVGITLIRLTDIKLVGRVVEIHLRAFPGFFLTFLGPGFLHEFYAGLLLDLTGIMLGAFDGDRLIGFVAGTVEPAGLYSRLIRRRMVRFALAAVKPLVRRPTILARLWRALRKPAESQALGEKTALLMSIAVDPSAQNKRAGEMLLEAFCAECAQRDARRVCLTTDKDSNDLVNRFYERRGFVVTRTFVTPEGRTMNEYTRNLLDEKRAACHP